MTRSSERATNTPCPQHVNLRVGCKVEWKYYKTPEEAKIASEYAKREGYERAAQGYDFGYCAPGSISYIDPERSPNSEYAGLYEVCFP